MKDKPNDHWFEVYGMSGVRYMKDGKYYDPQKKPILPGGIVPEVPDINKKEAETVPEKVVEEPPKVIKEPENEIKENAFMPVLDLPDDLELVDRVKIKGPSDPNFLKKSEIKRELRKAGIKFSASDGRDALLDKLKESLGFHVEQSEDI